MSLLLSRKEKESLVIKLIKEGKTYGDIAKIVHISPTEIKKIIDKAIGDAKSSQKEKPRKLSPYARAIQMFKEGYKLEGVVIELDKDADTILPYYADYSKLKRMDCVVTSILCSKEELSIVYATL